MFIIAMRTRGWLRVWALVGIDDAESDAAPAPFDYEQHVNAILLVDKTTNPRAMDIAKRIVHLLQTVGISSRLGVVADD